MSKDDWRTKEFNDGKPFHGSERVKGGKLMAKTTTDYLVPFCPECGEKMPLEILDFEVTRDMPVKHDDDNEDGCDFKRDFTLAFEIECPECGLHDFFKMANQ